jgi:hypothetical protein
VTGPQRTRLVLALGGLNLVLATVAFGLAGSLTPTDETARATSTPSLSAPPIAGASPSPSAEPQGTLPPDAVPTQVPGESPSVPGPVEPGTPGSTASPGPNPAATSAPPLGAPPTSVPPTAAPPIVAAPTAAPPTPGPVASPAPQPATAKPKPPCPGTVTSAPGLTKGAGDASRPCRGGEHTGGPGGDHDDGQTGSIDDRGRGDERGRSRTNPCRGRHRREGA